jgi:hypothetical protein
MFDIDVRLLEIIVKGVLFVEIDILEGVLIVVFMFVRKIDVVVEIGLVEVEMVLVVVVNFVDDVV